MHTRAHKSRGSAEAVVGDMAAGPSEAKLRGSWGQTKSSCEFAAREVKRGEETLQSIGHSSAVDYC